MKTTFEILNLTSSEVKFIETYGMSLEKITYDNLKVGLSNIISYKEDFFIVIRIDGYLLGIPFLLNTHSISEFSEDDNSYKDTLHISQEFLILPLPNYAKENPKDETERLQIWYKDIDYIGFVPYLETSTFRYLSELELQEGVEISRELWSKPTDKIEIKLSKYRYPNDTCITTHTLVASNQYELLCSKIYFTNFLEWNFFLKRDIELELASDLGVYIGKLRVNGVKYIKSHTQELLSPQLVNRAIVYHAEPMISLGIFIDDENRQYYKEKSEELETRGLPSFCFMYQDIDDREFLIVQIPVQYLLTITAIDTGKSLLHLDKSRNF